MRDLIDRQAAIEAVRSYMADSAIEDSDWHADGIAYDIRRLPSAVPKTGHWMWSVDEYGESWFCSECLSEYVAEEGIPTWAHFCPNCGARMGGEQG